MYPPISSRQLQPELLDGVEGRRRAEVLVQDECISDAYIKQEVEDILVEFPTLHLEVVVAAELVPSVHTTHVLVVTDDGFWGGTETRVPSLWCRRTVPVASG